MPPPRGPRRRGRGRGAPRWLGRASLVAALAAASPSKASGERCEGAWPWSRLDRSARQFVTPTPLLLTAGALVAPLALSPTGADHWVRLRSQKELGGRHDLEHVTLFAPAAWVGSALTSYVLMRVTDAPCRQLRLGAAMTQAMATSFGVMATLKFVVGRSWPNGGADPSSADRLSRPELATHYSPFAGEGIAWPSGHTAMSFAAAAAIRSSLPKNAWARWLGYPLAIGVGLGMIWGDHHWASDVVSGALLGEAIGSATGASFGEQREGRQGGWRLVPLGGEVRGVALAGSF